MKIFKDVLNDKIQTFVKGGVVGSLKMNHYEP